MIFAIDVPHSKSISIVFTSLKSMIFGLMIIIVAKNIDDYDNNQKQRYSPCSQDYVSYMNVLQILFILGIIVDIVVLIYFYLQRQFKKIEYYLFYFFHIALSLFIIISGINKNYEYTQCDVGKALESALFSSSLVLQANILVAMISNLFIILKFLHFGSNFVWIFIWLYLGPCNRIDITIVAMINTILSAINIVSLLIYRWKGKLPSIVTFLRTLCMISLLAMIFCYLIILVGLTSQSRCQNSDFFQRAYKAYGWIQIISPLLMLMFMRNENGDPRQKVIKRHHQVFTKLRQNENAANQGQL